ERIHGAASRRDARRGRRRSRARERPRRRDARGDVGRGVAQGLCPRGGQAMSITNFFVKRWQFTVVLFAMLAALGVSSWKRIPRAEDPVFRIPIFKGVAVYPGATAEDMEQLVVDKIENRLKPLEQVQKITSKAEDGVAVLRLEFIPEVDADRKET